MDKPRSFNRLQAHYEIERELADRLRRASQEERGGMYAKIYDELFERVPDHVQSTRKVTPEERQRQLVPLVDFLRKFVTQDTRMLELGCGDCALSVVMSRLCREIIGLDVSDVISKMPERPANFRFLLVNSVAIPLEDRAVDVVYSNQLMEHLHPEDAAQQLQEILRVLRPGGIYICLTPSKYSGPHDITGLHDHVSTGLHLQEYGREELVSIFLNSGFSRCRLWSGGKFGKSNMYVPVPVAVIGIVERVVARLPAPTRIELRYSRVWSRLLDATVVATK